MSSGPARRLGGVAPSASPTPRSTLVIVARSGGVDVAVPGGVELTFVDGA